MAQSIGQKFTPVTLLKFALPSMVMMVLMSCYTITDGIFISRFLGDNALSAVNIVYPVINIVLAIGVMLATGGSAVVAKKMGEGKDDEAKDNFSMLVFTGVVASVVILSWDSSTFSLSREIFILQNFIFMEVSFPLQVLTVHPKW